MAHWVKCLPSKHENRSLHPFYTCKLRSWGLKDSGLTVGEPAWDQPRTSACDDSCVTWFVCGVPNSKIRTCPWHISWLSGTHSPCRDTLTSLEIGGRAWSWLNMLWHALLIPMGGLLLSEWRKRKSGWRDRQEEGYQN